MSCKYWSASGAALLVALCGVVPGANAGAEVRPYIGLESGLGTFSFAEKLDQKIVFPVINLTGGLAYRRFNLAANVSGSLEDAQVSEEDFTGAASRRDLDFTAAYQVNKNLSGFVGYKDGETKMALTSRDPMAAAGGREHYRQSGPFVGINCGWRLAASGKLDISVAYAVLDAENLFFSDADGVETGEVIEFDDIRGRVAGSSDGYSINLNWTQPINGNLLFRARLKYNAYEQDIDFEGVTFGGIKEESAMLLVGVLGVF